jgi:tetratricopeptide (TPR) repeat protein
MGCNESTAATVIFPVPPIEPPKAKEIRENTPTKDEKDNAHVMFSQLFKEILVRMNENDRSKIISYCPDLYTEDDIYDLITKNPQLFNLTNYMREKIEDENPLFALGRLMLEMGSYDRAEYFYLKALPTEGHNWIRQAALLNNLGKVYQEQDKYDQALEYYEKAVKLQREHFPEDHPSLSADYSNIGSVYQKQNKLDLALEYFQRALKIEMNSSQPDEELVALFNNNIGLIYNDQKKFKQGLIYHEKCLEMNEKILPPTHPSLALSHHNLAISLFSLARFDDALDHAQKAVHITSQSLPNGHPQRAAHQDLINTIQKRM